MSHEFPLTDVGEVVERSEVDEVNRYLAAGWMLITTHTVDRSHLQARRQQTVYVLGWRRQNGPPRHPRHPDAHSLEDGSRSKRVSE